MSHFILIFVVLTFAMKLEDDQLWKSLKYFSILGPMKNDIRFEYFTWKNVWFCFISIAWVHFSHKTEKFRFWKSLKYFIFFIKKKTPKNDVRFEYVLSNSVWFGGLSFVVWLEFWGEVEKYGFQTLLK